MNEIKNYNNYQSKANRITQSTPIFKNSLSQINNDNDYNKLTIEQKNFEKALKDAFNRDNTIVKKSDKKDNHMNINSNFTNNPCISEKQQRPAHKEKTHATVQRHLIFLKN